jgi:hypothetical protein
MPSTYDEKPGMALTKTSPFALPSAARVHVNRRFGELLRMLAGAT